VPQGVRNLVLVGYHHDIAEAHRTIAEFDNASGVAPNTHAKKDFIRGRAWS